MLVCIDRGRVRATWLACAFALHSATSGAQTPGPENRHPRTTRPLDIGAVLGMRSLASFSPVALAPTGKWVAFTVRQPHSRAPVLGTTGRYFLPNGRSTKVDDTELWVTNTGLGTSRNLTGAVGVSWSGTWAPDGRLLAFLSDRDGYPRLWLWDAKTGRIRRASQVIVRTFYPMEGPRWTPDGRYILVKLAPERSWLAVAEDSVRRSPAGDSAVVRVFGGITAGTNIGMSAWFEGDLGLIDVRTGAVRRLVHAAPIPNYAVSPTGEQIAFTVLRGMAGYQSQDCYLDLAVVDLVDGSRRTLAHNILGNELGYFTWSPDGRAIGYVTTTIGKDDPENCWVIPLDGGPPINVSPGRHPRLGNFARGPLWAPDGLSLYLVGGDTLWRAKRDGSALTPIASVLGHEVTSIIASPFGVTPWSPPDDHGLYVTIRDSTTQQEGVSRIDSRTGAEHILFEDSVSGFSHGFDGLKIDASTDQVVFGLQKADTPEDLWIAGRGFVAPRRLTHLNPQLDQYAYGRTRQIDWLSLDGDRLHGILLLPPNYTPQHRYPVLVWVYGGVARSTAEPNQFGLVSLTFNMQVLATRGYVVLAPDAPQHLGTPMNDLAKTVLPGVNKLIELGIGDSSRLAIAGYSYGGYAAMALVTETNRFSAAIDIAGVGANLLSEYALLNEVGYSWGTGWAESGQGLMGATPWERRDRYIENSPFFYLDRVTTPVLLIHGDQDDPVLSRETYTALRRLGKQVVYAEYPGVHHAFSEASLAQQRDYYTRVLNWLDQYLGRDTSESRTNAF